MASVCKGMVTMYYHVYTIYQSEMFSSALFKRTEMLAIAAVWCIFSLFKKALACSLGVITTI